MTDQIRLFQESLPLTRKIELTSVSLQVTDELDAIERELIWQKLAQVHGGTQWWIGDFYNATKKYGRGPEMAEENGLESKTVYTYGEVCSKVPIRMGTLTFAHHQLVAAMDPADQRHWLKLAECNKWTVAQLRAEIKLKKPTPIPELPPNKYNLIYADPPWRYDFSPTSGRKVERYYPTMELKDIKAVDVSSIAYDNCTLFLWGTSPKLPWAFEVMEAWGFEYKTCMVWVKDKIGMGYYARQQHELLLIGGIGDSQLPLPEARPSSVIMSPRTEHSRKPPEVYDLLEFMYPAAARAELFGRKKRAGWTVWGNEVALDARLP